MAEQVKKRRKWWIIPIVIVGVIATLGIGAFVLLKNTILMSFPELKGEPNVGIYIWDYKADSSTKNTQHTIISSDFLVKLEENKSVADWIIDAVNGNVKTYGLNLLDK